MEPTIMSKRKSALHTLTAEPRPTTVRPSWRNYGLQIAILASLLLTSMATKALTFSAVASGSWDDASTWNQSRFPAAGDDIATLAGHTVTITKDAAIGTGAAFALSVGNNSTLILSENITLTVNGDFVQDGYASEVFLNASSAILFNPAANELFEYRRTSQHQTLTFDGRPNERARVGLTPGAAGGYFFSSNGARDQLLAGSYGQIEDSFDPATDFGLRIFLNNTAGVSSIVANRIEFIRCGSIQILGFGAGANTEVDINGWTFRSQRFTAGALQPAFWFDGYPSANADVPNHATATKSITNIVSDTPINLRFVQGYTLDNFVLDSSTSTRNMGNARASNLGGDAITHNNVFRADLTGETLNLVASMQDTSYFYSETDNPHGWSTQQLRGDATLRNFWFESNRAMQNDTGEAVLTNGPQASVALSPPRPTPIITLEHSGTIGDSSSDQMHPALFAYNNSEGIRLIANHNVARVQTGWHAIQVDENGTTESGAGVALTNNVFFGDAANAGYGIGSAIGDVAINSDIFDLIDFNLYFNLKTDGPDGALGVHQLPFSASNTVDQNSLIADPQFLDAGRNLASWDESIRGDGLPGDARHAIDEMKKRNDDTGYNPAYTVEALVEYVALGHAVTNVQATGSDGQPIGQTTHLPPSAPIFTLQPSTAMPLAGSDITLISAATGNPAPSFQWFLDGVAIAGQTGESLQLTGITSADAGVYYVQATNFTGVVQSDDASVTLDTDADGDGVGDSSDNCTNLANALQTDSNGDGIGNRCDADLNNDCAVDLLDFGIFRSQLFTTNADPDFNADGTVDLLDFAIFRSLLFQPVGPSATQCTL